MKKPPASQDLQRLVPSSPRRGREAPRAEQHPLDVPDVALDLLDLVLGLAPRRAVQVAAADAEGLGRVRQGVQVAAEVVQGALGLAEAVGLRGEVGAEVADGRDEPAQLVGLLLRRGRGAVLGGRGGAARRGGVGQAARRRGRRGLHADVPVEELGRVVVAAGVVVRCVCVLGGGGVCGPREGRPLPCGVVRLGDLGHGVLQLLDELRQVLVRVLVEFDAGIGEGVDHRADEVLCGAVDEGGEAGDYAEGVEEARGGDQRRGFGRLGEELWVGDYRRLVCLDVWI